MGAGEARSGGAEKLSLLADAFEARRRGDLPRRRRWRRRRRSCGASSSRRSPGIDIGDLSFHDYKTTLQETAQSLGLPLPDYRVVEESGPDHEKAFVVELAWDGEPFARGQGPSKREAQRKAAKEALKKLGRLPA